MNRRNLLTGLLILVALGIIALAWLSLSSRAPVPVACTEEAKLCPDGSAVGRTGPHCEFAPCPFVSTSTTPAPVACTTEAKLCPDGSSVGRIGPKCEFEQCPSSTARGISIGKTATIHGTTIGVLELVEDSRCPVDVQCIQAGTVRVRTSIDSYNRDFTFTLLQPQVVGKVTITLASVIPAQKHAKQIIGTSDYRFIFTVTPVATPDPAKSGIRGTILLGPTCPVMRDPPDPQCADKPYATTILVYRVGSDAVVAKGKSAADGTFEISLPAGTYTLAASGGTTLPRCAPADVIVGESGYVTAHISCDTGIR